jgi:chromosome segregation ATPase
VSRPSSAAPRPSTASRPPSTVPKPSASSLPPAAPSAPAPEEDDLPVDGVGAQSVIRFQKAKIQSLEGTVAALTQQLQSQQQERHKAAEQHRGLQDEHGKLQKRLAACEAALGKHKQVAVDCRRRSEELERDALGHKKEIERLLAARGKADAEAKTQENKLARALVELERARGKAQAHAEQGPKESKADVSKLESDNRRLLQQKNDLLLAMKKQYKLITILKKQLAHLEAARMIQFAEQDFIKAMQTDGHI